MSEEKKPSEKMINFLKLVSKTPSTSMVDIEWRIRNRQWLRKSQRMALKLILGLEKIDVHKNQFIIDICKEYNLKPDYVHNWMRGSHDFKMSEIVIIENYLKKKK